MERILSIEKEHFKNHYAGHLAAALLFCLFAPVIVGMEALNRYQAGQVLDMYFSLLGIVLLTPLFMPEQNKDIRDLLARVSGEKCPAIAAAAGGFGFGIDEFVYFISDETGGVYIPLWNLFFMYDGKLYFSWGPWDFCLWDHR